MVAKNKKYKEIGEELNSGTAYIQATRALDVAAYMAEDSKDLETLLTIAQTYIAIGERLSPHYEEEEEGSPAFGFTSAIAEVTIDPDAVEYEDFDDEEDDVEV